MIIKKNYYALNLTAINYRNGDII